MDTALAELVRRLSANNGVLLGAVCALIETNVLDIVIIS